MTVNLFDVNFYRFANPDFASAGLTTDAQLTNHFQAYGLNEGRRFSAVADANFYRASNSDLTAAGLSSNAQLLDHMQRYGVAEGRSFSAFVNLNFYLASNSDVNSAVGGNRETALNHLRTYGIGEGRSFSEFVDVNAYLNYNPDVKQAYSGNRVQGLNHLEVYGVNEGRQFSPFVDLIQYLANNADLKQAFGSNRTLALNHLEINGLNEGRRFAAGFDVNYYRAANSDLAAAGINTNLLAYRHWVQLGFNEGRFAYADPGDSNATATNIGTLTQGHAAILSRSINSGGNSTDYYQFTVDKLTNIYVHHLRDSGKSFGNFVRISNPNGDISTGSSYSSGSVFSPGTYYLRLSTQSTSRYAISLEATAAVGVDVYDLAGNDFSRAFSLSLQKNDKFGVFGSVTTTGTVFSSLDQYDFYKVDLSTSGSLSASLSILQGDADLFLYDASGTYITDSSNSGNTLDNITRPLAQGTYYIRVTGFDTLTDYDIDIQLN